MEPRLCGRHSRRGSDTNTTILPHSAHPPPDLEQPEGPFESMSHLSVFLCLKLLWSPLRLIPYPLPTFTSHPTPALTLLQHFWLCYCSSNTQRICHWLPGLQTVVVHFSIIIMVFISWSDSVFINLQLWSGLFFILSLMRTKLFFLVSPTSGTDPHIVEI